MFTNCKKLFFLYIVAVPALGAGSEVSVSNKLTTLDSSVNNSSKIISVANPSKELPVFVRVGIYQIESESIGTEKEELLEIKGDLKKDSLIALPNKIAIPPNGRANVRLIYTGKPINKDANFKVRFYPVSEVEYKNGVSGESTAASVFFSISSTSYVSVIKSNPNYRVLVKNGIVSNEGDSIAELSNCKICNDGSCELYSGFRLPPGRTINFTNFSENEREVSWRCDLNEPLLGNRVVKSSDG
jgi:hypothetical protein